MWDVIIKMNSNIDSTNVLVANLKPLKWALWLHSSHSTSIALLPLLMNLAPIYLKQTINTDRAFFSTDNFLKLIATSRTPIGKTGLATFARSY